MTSHELPPTSDHTKAVDHQGAHPMPELKRIILDPQMVKEHVGNPENIQWVKLKDLLHEVAESCVDGREAQGIIGTAGGNAGEFVLLMAAAEQVTGTPFSPEEIKTFFNTYLEQFGKFYMHTDQHGLEHMFQAVGSDPAFADQKLESVQDMEQVVRACPPQLQQSLLRHLTNPNNIGCGHLKLALKMSEAYQVRPEVVQTMMEAYFEALWAGHQNIEYVVLEGDHAEGAVVTIFVESREVELDDEDEVPTISPLANGTSFFTAHPQAINYLRRKISTQVAEQGLLKGIDQSNLATFQDRLKKLGGTQLTETVKQLANDDNGVPLPILELVFNRDKQLTA